MFRCIKTILNIALITILAVIIDHNLSVSAQEELKGFDLEMKKTAEKCKKEATEQFDLLLSSGRLTIGQLFDTFYIPTPNTSPQKYRTQYDKYSDEVLQGILDGFLKDNSNLIFVIIVDRNGYVRAGAHRSKGLDQRPVFDADHLCRKNPCCRGGPGSA